MRGPPSTSTTPKLEKQNENTRTEAAAMAGTRSRSVTFMRAVKRPAPSIRAASPRRGSRDDHAPPTMRTTMETL